MVRAESVITALIGAVLGLVLGVVFAVIVSRPLADDGFVLTFPVVTLIAVTILAAIAGVLAAIPPARRASKVDLAAHSVVTARRTSTFEARRGCTSTRWTTRGRCWSSVTGRAAA